jgi:hypothetical protein
MAFFTWLYVAWAYVGHEVTGKYAYFFLDHKKIGWEYTASAIAAFAVLSNACELHPKSFETPAD